MICEKFEIFADSHFTLWTDSYYTIYRNGKFEIVKENKNDINQSKVIFTGSFKECEKHRNEMKTNYINEKLGRKVKK